MKGLAEENICLYNVKCWLLLDQNIVLVMIFSSFGSNSRLISIFISQINLA